MSRRLLAGIALAIIIIVCVCYIVVGGGVERSKPMVYVKLRMEDEPKIVYGLIYENGKMKTLRDAFESDDVNVFVADSWNFSSRISGNKVVNSVSSTMVTDGHGDEIPADNTIQGILQTLAEGIDHEIYEAKIFEDNGDYFIAVKVNVNWQSPCDFYQYNTATEELKYLITWQDADVLKVSVDRE